MNRNVGLLLIASPIAILISAVSLVYFPPESRPQLPAPPVLPTELQVAYDLFVQAISLDPANQDAYDALASLYASAGEIVAADTVWDTAAKANPRDAWPSIAQSELRRATGDFAGQLVALERAASIDDSNAALPAEVSNLRRIVASHAVAHDYSARLEHTDHSPMVFTPSAAMLADGWTLVGTLTEPQTLFSGSIAPLWAFWLSPLPNQSAGPPEQGWKALDGGVWVQDIGATRSLIFDGDFERSLQRGSPLGFPESQSQAEMPKQGIHSLIRNGVTTTVAILHNDPAAARSDFTAKTVPIEPGKVVMLAGWIRSADGSAALGYRWAKGGVDSATEYLESGKHDDMWQFVADVFEVPPTATGFITVLANNRSASSAYFDDILALTLDRPGLEE